MSAAEPEPRPASAPRLTGCVVAMNEEDRLPACLASLDFCDELIVVDSHSTDRTRELAAAAGARVFERDWPGFGPQKNFAVQQASHDWVLCLDADERVSPELRRSILAARERGFEGARGYEVARCSNWFGRYLRHGSWYPDRQLRLYHRAAGAWNDTEPHNKVQLDGPAGRLEGDLLHEPYRSLSEHLRIIDKYTTSMAEELVARGKRVGPQHLVLNPFWRGFQFYVLQRGFLDGWRGAAMAGITMHYVHMKYLKAWLLQEGLGRP